MGSIFIFFFLQINGCSFLLTKVLLEVKLDYHIEAFG